MHSSQSNVRRAEVRSALVGCKAQRQREQRRSGKEQTGKARRSNTGYPAVVRCRAKDQPHSGYRVDPELAMEGHSAAHGCWAPDIEDNQRRAETHRELHTQAAPSENKSGSGGCMWSTAGTSLGHVGEADLPTPKNQGGAARCRLAGGAGSAPAAADKARGHLCAGTEWGRGGG